MVLPIVLLNDELHQKSENLSLAAISKVIPNLFDTLATTTGVGLAAPQVGLMYRAFVINVKNYRTGEVYKEAIVNPELISHSDEVVNEIEGCLSVPGIQERVERYSSVKIKYFNEKAEPIEREFRGLLAIIVQHEMDHLDGIVFTDKLPKVRLKKLRHDIENIQNRKVTNISYRYK